MLVVIEVGADQGVAALDVVSQVGECPLPPELHLALQAVLVLVLQDLEQEAELGHLDRLAVDIDAVDVVEQDPLLLPGGQIPLPALSLVDRHLGVFSGDVFFQGGFGDVFILALGGDEVLQVPVAVVVVEGVIGPDQEGAGAAGGVEDPQFLDLLRGLPLAELADGILDDVIDDVGRGVIDAAGLSDFRLLLHLGLVALGQLDHLAEKLLVDVAEDLRPQDRELVGALRVIEALEDIFQDLVIDLQVKGQLVGGRGRVFLPTEVEEAGVILVVGQEVELLQPPVYLLAVGQGLEPAVGLDPPVLADAQEDYPIDRPLDGEVELADSQAGVSQGEVAGQEVAPVLYLLEELHVDFLGGPLLLRLDELIEPPLEDRLLGEDVGDLLPLLQVIVVGEVDHPAVAGLILELGTEAAVVNGELLEVGEDGEGEPGRPGVTAELVGGADIALDIDRGFLGLDEELPGPADPEAVVGGLGGPADLDRVLGDDVLVGLGVTLLVIDVPAQGLEEGVDELGADVGFLVTGSLIGLQVPVKDFHQPLNFIRRFHLRSTSGLLGNNSP